ncbi:(2Fe-2S) ferredoxin domain-containing protein [Paenibacillus albidus]|uniref:(2Fe-2S) ferredoxin domain-containing protein n=1 Tax=Paenibacillus albidus TaxID=2041023 RepID=UPI001BE6E58F|nr:(2Fe-2S) ferredoxin domain-containing protein [Paenibacillus albidus]MBT2290771.1 (2Fe-2S) ferredoxin domain-containing protein [Paenibacillus albidus]
MTTWNLQGTVSHLLICNGSSCRKHKGEEVAAAIEQEIGKQGAEARIHTTVTRCNGRCSDACVVIAYPEGVWYQGITPKLAKKLVRKHLKGKQLKENVVYTFNKKLKAVDQRGGKGKQKP